MRFTPLMLVVLLSMITADSAGRGKPDGVPPAATTPGVFNQAAGQLLQSTSSLQQLANRETAGPDTFVLYGGPGHPTEGKFQLPDGTTPDWGGGNGLPGGSYGGGPEAWTPVDLTHDPPFWHVDTFNAENLNSRGPCNHAMWCGIAAGDPRSESWVTAPGYGNSWNQLLLYESDPVSDPSLAQLVGLDFFFNHEIEPAWDFFIVEFDSAGTWVEVSRIDGTSADELGIFQAPGVQYSSIAMRPIQFDGGDYGEADRIRIRLRVTSDPVWSDEDGVWPSVAGAVQLDDITVSHLQGTFTEDFEGLGPYLFEPDQAPFAGDFAEVYRSLTDIDPCRENTTPVVGFIDFNQTVRNGPGVFGEASTGGSTTPGIEYGIPGNWVVNHSGGIGSDAIRIENEIWSPEILWDLPGGDGDGAGFVGAFLRFTVWSDLPLIDGIFYVWHVRSALAGESFGPWQDRSFVYFGEGLSSWRNDRYDVTDLLQQEPERVQIALGVADYSIRFWLPGDGATPAPCFDNVALYKYRVGGPVISTGVVDLAQDGFPINGSIDVSTQASRDALDIPFDMARDINTRDLNNVAGDSVTIDVEAMIPGTELQDIRMVWSLRKNPVFKDEIRSVPSRPRDESVVGGSGIWSGEVVAEQSVSATGAVVADRFFMDLPDEDFLYPGDVLHYYFRATDNVGRVTTLPSDTGGFGDFSEGGGFSRDFIVRGLPSINQLLGHQPETLVINDSGGSADAAINALTELTQVEGIDFDVYRVAGAPERISNGIGSAGVHGATAQQLGGYENILYLAGDLTNTLSDGSNEWMSDLSDDLAVLAAWSDLPTTFGARRIAYFGDSIAYSLVAWGSAEAAAFLYAQIGAGYVSADVTPAIGGQVAPMVARSLYAPSWFADFTVAGGCPGPASMDHIRASSPGSLPFHQFLDRYGVPYYDSAAASVYKPSDYGFDILFPYGFERIEDPPARTYLSSGAQLLKDLFELRIVVHAEPATLRPVTLDARPNPFNPSTVVEFTAPAGSNGSVKIYNLRGELVRTLHNGEFQIQTFTWDGTDARGAAVASGVYVVRAEVGGHAQTVKAALVK